ncbi:DUF6319 family protein [Gordonia aichiensis]|uniref:DUF6319 family protein n=1 Tax=Gordonia aichiensis TaxID=36820 RepID=UPI003266EED3
MPPRRRPVTESLTPDDLTALAAAVAEGRRATVYLREGTPSLNLTPGSSARVISVSGSTVVIRPRGVDDELPYEADELRMTKNPPPPPEPKVTAAPKAKAPAPAPARKVAAPAPTPATTPPATKPPATQPPVKKAARAKATGTKAASVTVTLYGSADNEWAVAVTRGARKPNRSRPVPVESVESAVRELGDEATVDAVTTLMHAAREAAQRRVDELSAQLAQAREALAALE